MANNQLLASDNFASGSLAAGWGTFFGLSKCQVVSGSPNVTEPNVAGTAAGQIWTGLTWPNDQISEVTLGAALTTSSSNTIGLVVRFAQGVQSGYLAVINGGGGLFVFKSVAGTFTQLGSSTTSGITWSAGDVISFVAAGAGISVYHNFTRIYYFYDTTFTSGSPGYDQNSTGSVTASQVASWRGYSAVQQDGVWQKRGIVLAPILTDLNQTSAGAGIQIWSLFQDTNAQILSGTVYKTWIVSDWTNDAASEMYYAESLDGINWTRKTAAVLSGVTNGYVIKNGNTYYLYGQASGSSGSGNMLVYTSSDGISWTPQTPSNVIGLGSAGAWDSSSFYNIIAVAIVSGTWYGFYNGFKSGAAGFSTGLATSTDGINWTKYAGNPVISNALVAGNLVQVGNTWYMWCTQNQPGQNASSQLDPFEIVRYSSSNLTTWAFSAHSIHRSQLFESVNANTGGANGGPVLNIGGKAYQYINSAQNDASAPQVGQIQLAIASAPLSSVVLFGEDGTQQTVTDPFTSGAGNLDGNWTTPTGGTALKIVSGPYVEPTITSTVCQAVYTGAAFQQNQYSEITLQALAGTLAQSLIEATVLANTANRACYAGVIYSPTATSDQAAQLGRYSTNGAFTNIGPTITVEPQVGDVWRTSVVFGNDGFPVLSLFQNGFLILQVQDTSSTPITSGNPGIAAYSSVAIADAQISLFAAGNTNVIPTYPSLGGQTGLQLSMDASLRNSGLRH